MSNSLQKNSSEKEIDLTITPSSVVDEAKTEVQHRDTSLGREDFDAVKMAASEKNTTKRGPYKRYTDADRLAIGKYSSENGASAAVRKFSKKHPRLNESTVRSMRQKYEEELKKVGFQESASSITPKKRGRPLLLGNDIDMMVQDYLKVDIIISLVLSSPE